MTCTHVCDSPSDVREKRHYYFNYLISHFFICLCVCVRELGGHITAGVSQWVVGKEGERQS